ncbi:MAG TPA: hypothetical protein VNM91_07830 [Dehalococcoidia bacterium]|nr:hypothetical protein [Dehalococcoidia bacterium]
MDAIVEASWRPYPSAAMMLAGAAILVAAARAAIGAGRLSAWDPGKGLAFMRAFRISIVGLALLSLGAAWMWHQTWLAVLALLIGGGELFESTLDISALRRAAKRQGLRP